MIRFERVEGKDALDYAPFMSQAPHLFEAYAQEGMTYETNFAIDFPRLISDLVAGRVLFIGVWEDSQLIGIVGASVWQSYFSPTLNGTIYIGYLKPEYRKVKNLAARGMIEMRKFLKDRKVVHSWWAKQRSLDPYVENNELLPE